MKTILIVALALLAALAGCGKQEQEQEPAQLDLDGLMNMTYAGIQEQNPVTLKNGVWEGEPFAEGAASRPVVRIVRDYHLFGDLDGDGADEAAVLLAAASGGSGNNIYLAVVGLKEGRLENLGTVLLGDRVQVRKGGIGEGRLFLDLLRAGPEDARCCPGDQVMLAWRLEKGVLTSTGAASAPRRLNFGTIADTEWVLRWWNLDEKAPAEPEVTFAYRDGRLVGTSGCNNWFVAPEMGDQPGEFSVGPTGGTMMMCPDDEMAVEKRFLGQLGESTRFGFMAGMLAVTYGVEEKPRVMLFEERKTK